MDSSECSKERRTGLQAIPEDIASRLTELQRHTLSSLGGFGWAIKFVRRPLFQDQVVVLVDPAGKLHAVLREDGSIDQDLDFEIR